MKLILLLSLGFASTITADGCKRASANADSCFKGRLEIKAQCMNYTIKVLDGKIDTSRVAGTWTDESTGKIHTNVFRLASICSFPPDLKEGDEFYFTIDSAPRSGDCVVCMAYYPTPPKELSIVVQKGRCQ